MRRLTLAILALLLFAAACGEADPTDIAEGGGTPAATTTPTEPAPAGTTEPDDQAPTATAEPTDTAGTEPAEPEPEGTAGVDEVDVFYARSGEDRIWIEPLSVQLDSPTVGMARAAMEALVEGPPADGDPGLSTIAPAGTTVLDVAVHDGGVLVVDLSDDVLDGSAAGSASEDAFAQQLAYTGAQFSSVERVQLWVEGEPVSELWGHLDWSEPVAPAEFVLSPVTFDSHAWGEEVPSGSVTVGGKATTFEGTVLLRLLDPSGELNEEAFTTATEGGPGRGDWEYTFELTTPGTWTVEASESDPSDGEGRAPYTAILELEAG